MEVISPAKIASWLNKGGTARLEAVAVAVAVALQPRSASLDLLGGGGVRGGGGGSLVPVPEPSHCRRLRGHEPARGM